MFVCWLSKAAFWSRSATAVAALRYVKVAQLVFLIKKQSIWQACVQLLFLTSEVGHILHTKSLDTLHWQ